MATLPVPSANGVWADPKAPATAQAGLRPFLRLQLPACRPQFISHLSYGTTRRTCTLDNLALGENQKLPADARPQDPASYKAFTGKQYAPDLYAEQALHFIRDNKDQPFFLFSRRSSRISPCRSRKIRSRNTKANFQKHLTRVAKVIFPIAHPTPLTPP